MKTTQLLSTTAVALFCAGLAVAQVGEPTGLTVTVRQGANVIAHDTVTIGPGGDLTDIKVNDGTPEDLTQIGVLNGPAGPAPLIMKVVTGDDPFFRLLSVFINAPLSLAEPHVAGPYPMFNPLDPAPISVEISNATFAGTTFATPFLVGNNSFFTGFMRDAMGHFFELPQANAFNSYGHGILDIQVPGERFLDGNVALYNWSGVSGPAAAWIWGGIPNPGPASTVHNGLQSGVPSAGGGHVFELGLTVALVGVPEPATLALLAAGLCLVRRPRRR